MIRVGSNLGAGEMISAYVGLEDPVKYVGCGGFSFEDSSEAEIF